ncbi:pyruvate dehydrogenase complex dihydrolipoamide acetyltransferase [Kwoniella shandongensis]|uniref:Acetyltransferase component of pyruvate dehydrogenase complex n=1 Tax=Kwoniella shandongensis TaxID=1734106 RepID=A0A5M6BXX2_9TREE|nr:pyruvate dehydrogenase complex dihydrolipoamide acetyltransferase [Kwoniella shandongensis]KAA5526742.1 pyruvate dehydrogenase complex dihydrolipoamide acetyltransferase [Kwoniella shandongensis]
MLSFAHVAKRSAAAGLRKQVVSSRTLRTSAPSSALSKFTMPAMSPTMTEGGITEWKKKEGESFSAGDVLIEVETDKATIDVEAQDDGIMAKILRQDGEKGIAVGTPIAIIGEEGDDLSGADALAATADEAPSAVPQKGDDAAPKETEEKKPEPKKEESKASTTPMLGTPADETKYGSGNQDTSAQKAPELASQGEKPKFFASPLARKIALEKGIPLGEIKGSGPEGRIVRADVEKYKPSASSAAKTPTSGATALPGKAAPASSAEYEDVPTSNMRKTIGKRLTESKQQLPHYYLTVEVNMDRVLKLRQLFNKAGEGKTKLSVNDFIVKAASLALAEVPEANSAWLGETIRTYKKADICVAVATPNGLITPIIKDVGAKGLASISAETKALASRAREGKLKPEEYQGGSFTISNLGMFGIDNFTAIINPPQSCILAIGKTDSKLVLAPEEPKGFKEIQVMKATLSSDHRTVDGAVGAKWLKAFKDYMEQPLTFML